ncbi:unnamed protein product [Owenia fusiformis]|uniref:Uncharacterized protein n=1 Tax=Owenia fusiformis TaxID=6347 RepID=A0A8J1TFA2_OWEFU|nr:unnamed protein product [Owenia fusiformis]
MGSNVLTSLIQDAILKLCTQHVTFDASLEIDGIICITPGQDAKEIVVKMHRTIMKPVTQPDQYAPEMDTNPSTPSSTSSATPHKRQRNRQGRDIDPNAYPQNVTSNVSFDEMPKPSIYDEDSGGGGYYNSEQQQQYATPDSTPSKSRKRRAAPAPEASTEEKYIKVEPGESEILVEEPTSVTPGNSNDGYTDPNQGMGNWNLGNSAAYVQGKSPNEEPDSICERCHHVFPTSRCMEYHTSVVHNGFCDVCNKRIDGEPNPENHGLKHTGLRPFQCDLCFKLFQTDSGLKRHKSKEIRCHICNNFVSVQNKSAHMKKHASQGQF